MKSQVELWMNTGFKDLGDDRFTWVNKNGKAHSERSFFTLLPQCSIKDYDEYCKALGKRSRYSDMIEMVK